jgi:hypothetical protein
MTLHTAAGNIIRRTALHEATNAGQLDAVRLLLERGADFGLATSSGFIPLMIAVDKGHMGIVREMAARGADLDAAEQNGITAFHIACVKNDPDSVAALVELGCDTSIKAKGIGTGKQSAEEKGSTAVLDRLCEVEARAAEGLKQREEEAKVFMEASNLEAVNIQHDANIQQVRPNMFNPTGSNANGLVLAADAGQLGEVRRLQGCWTVTPTQAR